MTQHDRWEVVRHRADGVNPSIITTHKSADLAAKAYTKALTEGFYAVDVNFLAKGNRLNFEPLYGTANGFYSQYHEGRAVYSEESFNWYSGE